MKKLVSFMGLILAVLLIQGCMYKVSDRVPKDGIMSRDEVKFPDANSTWTNDSRYPSLEALRKISSGMNKDDIRGLIGAPHFAEGLYAVVEWDYLFDLKQNADDPSQICQYKVIYDENYTARSFFWEPKSCEDIVKGKAKAISYELSSDFLFDFGKSNLKPNGKKEISNLVSKLDKSKLESIEVLGYTDPIGSSSANLNLSKKRADSVKNALVFLKIPASKISAVGLGEENQVKVCDNQLPRQELIECLAPNRRVVITTNIKK